MVRRNKFNFRILLKGNTIEKSLIIILLIITSNQALFTNGLSWLDEFVLLLLIGYRVIRFKEKMYFPMYMLMMFGGYILFSYLTLLLRHYNLNIYISEFFNNIKPLVIVLILMSYTITDETRNSILKAFIVINIPSLLIGIFQYIHRNDLIIGGLGIRNGVIRIQGISGHAISFAFNIVCLVFLVYELYVKQHKKNFFMIGSIMVLLLLLVLSQSRYPIALLFLISSFYFFQQRSNNTKILLCFLILFIFILNLESGIELVSKFIQGENNNVRMQGIMTMFKSLFVFPFFGTGLGTFGTQASHVYDSYVYPLFNIYLSNARLFTLNSGNYFESGIAQKIIENGLFGMAFYYGFFITQYKYFKYTKDALIYIFFALFILNSFANPIYSANLLILLSICMSNAYTNFKNASTMR